MFRFLRNRKLAKVRHVWGEGNIWNPNVQAHWLQHPAVKKRIEQKITDGQFGSRFEYFLRKYLQDRLPVERAITLGCGSGPLERNLHRYNFATCHEGVDVSEYAIDEARNAAGSAGMSHLEYRVADLNAITLAAGRYDVVFGFSSIHHIERLERVFAQIQRALKPSGFFVLDEYIGPSRFQWTEAQLRAMNTELARLPAALKYRVTNPKEMKDQVIRKTIKYMIEADPSEAVRSADIVPLLHQYFNVLEFRGYGGSLLHELLYDITGNFNESNPGSLECLERLFRVEDELIARGELSHDFALIIATV